MFTGSLNGRAACPQHAFMSNPFSLKLMPCGYQEKVTRPMLHHCLAPPDSNEDQLAVFS